LRRSSELSASRPTLKDSVEKVVRQLKGVEEVINQIEVLPLSGSDDELRADLYANIYGPLDFMPFISSSKLEMSPWRGWSITQDTK
jgi:hypothetical protein